MKAWAIARRELGAYLRSPVAYLVATLFLLVEGYTFWLFLSLSNQRAAPADAPLRYFFGGSFLFWLFMMFLAAVVTMRLVAEERRLGTIETLLTAPVSAAEVIAGKYVAALAFYVLLWAPTLVYVALLARLLPAGASLDAGPVAAGYLGTLLVGASALAVGLAASTVTQHQLAAVVLAFLALLLLLLVGAATEVAAPGGTARALLERVSLFRQMEDFGRGVIDTRAVAYHLGLVAVALWAAARLVDLRARGSAARTAVELALLVAIVVAADGLAERHYRRFDLTRAAANTLAPRTEEVLARLSAPVEAHVLLLPTGADDDIHPAVRDLLGLMAARAPRLRVDLVDADRDPDRVRALAKRFGMSGDELEAGAVVFERAGTPPRTRFVGRADMAEVEVDADGRRRVRALRAEAAFDAALLALEASRSTLVCFTSGHGELRVDSLAVDGMSDLGEALERVGDRLRTLDVLERGVPGECDVTVLAGPERPFSVTERAALEAALARGARLLVLLGPPLEPARRGAPTGIEPLLERFGVRPLDAVVLDPAVQMSTSALAWAVESGYADHPITRALVGDRTVWSLARPLEPVRRGGLVVTELVRTSDDAFAATDLDRVVRDPEHLAYDAKRDRRGPLAVAIAVEAAGGARLVALGARGIARNDHDVYFNRDLVERAIGWLAGTAPEVSLPARVPVQLRLSLTEAQRDRALWVCVVGLPLCCALLGAGVWWRRRR